MASTPDWIKMGEKLVRRRIELDPRYVNRQLFATERGVSYRIATDIEKGRRANYEQGTIAAIEVAYSVTPGSIARALAGGELEPQPAPAEAGPAAALAPVVPLSLDDEESMIRHILNLPSPSGSGEKVAWGVRRGMIRSLLDLNDRRRNSEAGLPVPLALCN
jgi:hypothetical protein